MSKVETEVVGGRLYLIPPRGMLEKMKPNILRRLNGEIEYLKGFQLPSTKIPFEIELVVDDGCDICPVAVEIVSELVGMYKNVTAKIYNATYVEPPFAVAATPAFRINQRVRFTGLPLDPETIPKYLFNFLKEAYVKSHPKLQWLLDRLRKFGQTYGYLPHPHEPTFIDLLYRLLRNIDEYGYPFCPCRPLRRVEGATPQQLYELNKDKVCPCIYAHMDIKRFGHCLCGLFWSRQKVDEYVQKKLQEHGWIIQEIEVVQKLLEELKKSVIRGRGKILATTIINKLQQIYLALPD